MRTIAGTAGCVLLMLCAMTTGAADAPRIPVKIERFTDDGAIGVSLRREVEHDIFKSKIFKVAGAAENPTLFVAIRTTQADALLSYSFGVSYRHPCSGKTTFWQETSGTTQVDKAEELVGVAMDYLRKQRRHVMQRIESDRAACSKKPK